MTKLTKEEQVYTDIFDIVACYHEVEELNGGECIFSFDDETRNELISSLVEYVLNSRKA